MSDDSLISFRSEVRNFVAAQLPRDIAETVEAHRLISREQAQRWQRILSSVGWAAPGWPKEFGGTGWPLVKQAVLQEELLLSGAPAVESLGLGTIGPTIIRYGTDDQKQRFLSRIVNFDDYWAQAYSEPGAGSDLASLTCAANRDGDHYVVNGTKIWQSHGHWANWALALVRTSSGPKKQEGITVLLIDLKAPGVTVRPIKFVNGTIFHSQLFFDDVKVPVANRIGEEGAGWTIAKGLLVTERLFTGRVPECKRQLASLKKLAASSGADNSELRGQPWYARRIAELDIRLSAFEAAWWHAVERAQRGDDLGAEVLKLRLIGGALLQDLHGMQLEIAGSDGLLVDTDSLVDDGAAVKTSLTPTHAENIHIHHFRYRGISLGTGSAEVQRDLVAREMIEQAAVGDRPAAETEDEKALADTAARFVERDYSFEQRRNIIATKQSFNDKTWVTLSNIGVLGLLAREEDGGFGGRLRDLVIVSEQFGHGLVVEPYLWTAVAGIQIATSCGRTAAAAGLSVSDMVAGDQRVALAYLEPVARFDPAHCRTIATQSGAGWNLKGQKQLVWGVASANKVIVSARLDHEDGDIGLFCIDEASLPKLTNLKAYNDRAASVLSLDNIELPLTSLIVRGPQKLSLIEQVIDAVTLATCAEAIGAMDRALAITMDYMKTRKQFGRAISEFQTLRHRLVEHSLVLFNTRSLVRIAALAMSGEDKAAAKRAISAAKWYAGRAARQVGHDVLQLHGAIGFQDETAISHYGKFLVSFDAMMGDSEYHMTRFLAA